MDDNQIITLYFNRSEQAITETDTKYRNYCFTIANRILSSREDCEETINDTYLTVWNAIPPYRPPVFSLFLGKITRNLSIDRWRFLSAEKRGSGEFALCLDELADCASGIDYMEQEEIHQEIVTALNRFLKAQSEINRKVFLYRYWHLKSIPEISTIMGFSQTRVTTILYRTRIRLKAELKKEGLL